jgi:hypothetical protein
MIAYLLIGFFVFFFMWKKRGQEAMNPNNAYATAFETQAFWDIALTTLFWPIAIPFKLLWLGTDWAYEKFTKPKKK